MFFPLLIVGLGYLAFRGGPKTQTAVERSASVGAISGRVYDVERVPAANVIVVRTRDSDPTVAPACMALQMRDGQHHHIKSAGDGQSLRKIAEDFGVADFAPNIPGTSNGHGQSESNGAAT